MYILKRQGLRVETGPIWLRIGSSGWVLWTRLWTFGVHKSWRISWL